MLEYFVVYYLFIFFPAYYDFYPVSFFSKVFKESLKSFYKCLKKKFLKKIINNIPLEIITINNISTK